MVEGNTEAIQKALDSALRLFCNANNIAMQYENGELYLNDVLVEGSTSEPYLAGYFLPAPVEDADLYFTDRRSGVYQIDVNYSSGIGSATINRMVDLLNATFKPSATFIRSGVCVEVTNFSPERVTVSNGWAVKPVSITFSAYTARL